MMASLPHSLWCANCYADRVSLFDHQVHGILLELLGNTVSLVQS